MTTDYFTIVRKNSGCSQDAMEDMKELVADWETKVSIEFRNGILRAVIDDSIEGDICRCKGCKVFFPLLPANMYDDDHCPQCGA